MRVMLRCRDRNYKSEGNHKIAKRLVSRLSVEDMILVNKRSSRQNVKDRYHIEAFDKRACLLFRIRCSADKHSNSREHDVLRFEFRLATRFLERILN